MTEADDALWRRPSIPEPPPSAPPAPAPPVYNGPPHSDPPPPDWRPRTLMRVPPPRPLPPQDEAALDADEQQSRTITYGVGMVAGAVLLIVLFIVCGRALL